MTGSGHCHGPGCTQETSGDFCGEPCWRKWHGQHADTSKPGATILMTWTHPTHGRIEEHVCEVHERAILAALRALGMGCSGERFDAMRCVRCANLGKDPRTWLPACAVADEPLPASSSVASVQVASDPWANPRLIGPREPQPRRWRWGGWLG